MFKQKIEQAKAWLKKMLRDPWKSDIEKYLAQSESLADLENRMRRIQQRGYL